MKATAVIVTYNRLKDLKVCLAAVKRQTRTPEGIIVVNNGSTDGTKEYLASEEGVTVINQENLGGAGGFYAGMKYAYDNGYDWVWMMDDDGIAEDHQLENLLNTAEKYGYKALNALVLSTADHTRLPFSGQIPLRDLDLSQDTIEKPVCPFNGTLIHREVMDKIGFIKKEMFIWGDESEYIARMRKKGHFKFHTATKAIHYHPDEKGKRCSCIPGINNKYLQLLVKPSHMSHYYYRNLGYTDWHYGSCWGLKPMIRNMVVYTIYYLRIGNFTELRKFYKYYYKGMRNDYTS